MFLQIRATRRKLFVLALAGTRSGAFLGEPLQRHAQRRITQLLICFHVIEHQHDARQGGGSTLRIGYSTQLGLSCMQNLHLGMDKQSDRPRSSHRFACGLIPRFCSHQHIFINVGYGEEACIVGRRAGQCSSVVRRSMRQHAGALEACYKGGYTGHNECLSESGSAGDISASLSIASKSRSTMRAS